MRGKRAGGGSDGVGGRSGRGGREVMEKRGGSNGEEGFSVGGRRAPIFP